MTIMLCVLFAPTIVRAQSGDPLNNCVAEITDPDEKFRAELCSAHVGCKFVFAIQKTCAKVQSFLNGLRNAIGQGTKTLFGYKKEITPDAVFEASLSDNLKGGNYKLEIAEKAKIIRAQVRNAGKDELTGKSTNDGNWIYYGDVVDGKANGIGTYINAKGVIRRGNYIDGKSSGTTEALYPEEARWIGSGTYTNGKFSGEGILLKEAGAFKEGTYSDETFMAGKLITPEGVRFEGAFYKKGDLESGKKYRADGTLESEGRFENGEVVSGKRYDTAGNVSETVTVLEFRREAAARRQREAVESRATAEQKQRELEALALQKKRDSEARAEQQFRDSLNTMNPGQMFAKADELNDLGDSAKSKEVLRALISRFPNHALAGAAAQRLTGKNSAAVPERNVPSSRQSSNAPQGGSDYSSVCIRDSRKMDLQLRDVAIYYRKKFDRGLIDLYQRCAGYDKAAQDAVEELKSRLAQYEQNCNIDERSRKNCNNENATTELTQYERIAVTELAKALRDPNYSSDLKGGVGGPSMVSGDNEVSGVGSATCDFLLQRVGNVAAQNQPKIGQGAVKGMELVLWSLSESTKIIDQSCPKDSKYVSMREKMQASMLSTKRSCDQLSTITCVARLP